MSTKHSKAAEKFLQDSKMAAWHNETLWMVRAKRDKMSKEVPEWEELRNKACELKLYSNSHLEELLLEFEKNATANGAIVHWAKDADEYCAIVYEILNEHNVHHFIKSKSMLAEECGLNPFLMERGIDVVESDLGERILQLMHLEPSHIVLPAIHIKREQVGELFEKEMGTEKGNFDPTYLTHAARKNLRHLFLNAEAAMTGANFAVASTGDIVVCTNEGNADMGTSYPKLNIAAFGMEKIVPDLDALGVFTRLLARSATGQPVTTYTSHYRRPREGGEYHIIIVDNGRSALLSKPDHIKTLNCIRCGACMNTCPVYRRSGCGFARLVRFVELLDRDDVFRLIVSVTDVRNAAFARQVRAPIPILFARDIELERFSIVNVKFGEYGSRVKRRAVVLDTVIVSLQDLVAKGYQVLSTFTDDVTTARNGLTVLFDELLQNVRVEKIAVSRIHRKARPSVNRQAALDLNERLVEPLGLLKNRHRLTKIECDGRRSRLIEPREIEGVIVRADQVPVDRHLLFVRLRRVGLAKGKLTLLDKRGSGINICRPRKPNIFAQPPISGFGDVHRHECGQYGGRHDGRLGAASLGSPRLKFGNGRCSAGPMILQCFENLIHSGSPCFRLRGDEDARRSSARGQPSLSRERSVLRSPTCTSFRGRFVYLFRGIHQYL